MKKKKLFTNDSKYDYFRKISNDEAANIKGGDLPNTPNTPNTPNITYTPNTPNNTITNIPIVSGPINSGPIVIF